MWSVDKRRDKYKQTSWENSVTGIVSQMWLLLDFAIGFDFWAGNEECWVSSWDVCFGGFDMALQQIMYPEIVPVLCHSALNMA